MFKTISTKEMMGHNGLLVLDVREEDEYEDGIIPGAVLMPLSSITSQFRNLDITKHYHVLCHSGARSQMACMFLSNQGYQVTNVMGGMAEYSGELVYEV